MIKVKWSKSTTIASQKLNIHKIFSKKIPLNDRISTFEGKPHLSKDFPIKANTTKRKLQNIISNIGQHILDVSGGNIHISSMTLFLKVDLNGNIYLLFCSKVKVRNYVIFI